MVPCNNYNLYLLNVPFFCLHLTETESVRKIQAEGDLSVTHRHQQQQPAGDRPVERPQAKLSMCNVTSKLNERKGKPGKKEAAHFLKFEHFRWCQSHPQFVTTYMLKSIVAAS